MDTKNLPDLTFETTLWKKGVELIGGCDEVGRGCFAGPVVSACVVFPPTFKGLALQGNAKILINDSKKLSPLQREKADVWIRKNALAYGVGISSASKINKIGIIKATHLSFRQAIVNANDRLMKIQNAKRMQIEHLLVDAFYIPYVKGVTKNNQIPIVKGDGKSFSIAASSIVAKVYRDRLMTQLGQKNKYKRYCWHQNKGYGTRLHREAILKYGTTTHHREMFVSTFMSKAYQSQPTGFSNFVSSQVQSRT